MYSDRSIRHLQDVVDANAQIYQETGKVLEGHIAVLQKVTNLVARREEVQMRGGQVDFYHYLVEYWMCMLMADFATWLKTLVPEEKPLLVEASAEDTIVFGG